MSVAGLFHPVSPHRMAEAITEQIHTLIATGRLNEGDRLPSELELGRQVGASRVTVREALRTLEARGLITIRVGAHGGAYVTRPDSAQVSARLGEMLGLRDVNGVAVTEARLALELGLVPLVVERARPEDIAELLRLARQQVEDLRAGGYEPSTSARFHRRIAACAQNGAVDVLMSVLSGPLVVSLRQANQAVPHPGRRGAEEHLLFAEAVARRDTDGALEVMRRHIVRTGQRLGRSADLV